LFAATEAVSAYDWDTPRIQRVLREVSASMSDELDHLSGTAEEIPGPAVGRARV
jgi:hypothetical protein